MLAQFVIQNFNAIGIIGVILVLLAYFLLQIDRLKQDSVIYSLLNLVGSFLILVSLYFTWNLASGIIEIAWFLISVFGLVKAFYFKNKA
jgi:membrane-bound ClpP family serine protease